MSRIYFICRILWRSWVTYMGIIWSYNKSQFYDMLKILEVGGNPETEKFLFLGDYVDRGPYSCEVIILLYALKVVSWNSKIITRWIIPNRSISFEEIMSAGSWLPTSISMRRWSTSTIRKSMMWSWTPSITFLWLVWWMGNFWLYMEASVQNWSM